MDSIHLSHYHQKLLAHNSLEQWSLDEGAYNLHKKQKIQKLTVENALSVTPQMSNVKQNWKKPTISLQSYKNTKISSRLSSLGDQHPKREWGWSGCVLVIAIQLVDFSWCFCLKWKTATDTQRHTSLARSRCSRYWRPSCIFQSETTDINVYIKYKCL